MDWTTQIIDYLRHVLDALTRILDALWPFLHPNLIVNALLTDSLGLLLKVWNGFILQTTDFETAAPFTHNVTIGRFEPKVQLVANALLVLVALWGSYRIMWGHSVRSKFSARVLLPRLLLGVVLINFALPLFQAVVDSSNGVCQAIQSFGTIPDMKTWWQNYLLDQTAGVWQLITTGALVMGYDVLGVAYLVRYTILIFLAITAPLAALLFTLPDTNHWAKMWSSLFITNLLMQPVQLFILVVGFALENGGHTPVHHLFALAALLVVFKVPGAMGSAEKVAHKLESTLHAGFTSLEHMVAHAA